MRFKALFTCLWLSMLVSSCGERDTSVLAPSPTEVQGTWKIQSIPAGASNVVGTAKQTILILGTNGFAEFENLPINGANDQSNPLWQVVSGSGTWDMYNGGEKSRPVWKITLLTKVAGIPFKIIERNKRLMLIYKPDPDIEEQVEFIKK
jgi:hypothetical protein